MNESFRDILVRDLLNGSVMGVEERCKQAAHEIRILERRWLQAQERIRELEEGIASERGVVAPRDPG